VGELAAVSERCLVVGILNVTPDSFSDGGRYLRPDLAIEHGLRMAADGADLVDVGGESTRPGAHRITAAEELRRVLPVVTALARSGVRISIDTTRATVAAAALEAGAAWVNDVSGGRADPEMGAVVRSAGVPYVVMHWRGPSATMQRHAHYDDVVSDVVTELRAQVDRLCSTGVNPDQIILDPGLGFAKEPHHNWALLARLGDLSTFGPVLIGASRKSFLEAFATEHVRAGEHERDAASLAVATLAAAAGAYAVRVHDVARTAAAVRAAAALSSGVSSAALSRGWIASRSGVSPDEPVDGRVGVILKGGVGQVREDARLVDQGTGERVGGAGVEGAAG
jgi:dihydropteroate synthase